MRGVAGVFATRLDARRALDNLQRIVPGERLNYLTPGASAEELAAVPTTEDMPPVGGVIGGALGAAAGLGLGASLFVPGLGLITAAGAAATALLGVGGAIAGGAAGRAVDTAGSEGLPVDELSVYRDALAKGRTVIIAAVENDEEAKQVRQAMQDANAESIDPARDSWMVGVRDPDEIRYER